MSVVVSTTPHEDEERVGRYVVLRPIRKGGMGSLSLAFDTAAGEPVLLKRLFPNSTAELRERFLDEIKLTTALSHPNLVRARDSGQIDGRDFLVCDWIAGPDLERLLEVAGRYEIPIPPAVASGIIVQVLQGLGHMHEANCIHRDVSPANIMIGYDGVAHLIDYGITKFEGKRSKTLVGAVPGTQGFIAPELEAGKPATVKSDLYGVAASLWFALTGLKFLDHGVDNEGKAVLAHQLKTRGRDDVAPAVLTFLWRNLHRVLSVRCESAADAAQVLRQAVEPAEPAVIAEYVGRLLAGEKQLATEQLDEWRRKYTAAAQPTPALATAPQPSASSTAVLRPKVDAPRSASSTMVVSPAQMEPVAPTGSRAVRIVLAVGITIAVAVAIVVIVLHRPAQPVFVVSPPALAPAPHLPVVTSLEPQVHAPPSAPAPPVHAPIAVSPVHPAPPVVAPAAPAPKTPMLTADAKKRLKEAGELTDLGRTNSAREIYSELADDPAARPLALVGLAKLAYKDGKYSESVSVSSKALNAGAGPDALMVRASSYLRLGDGVKAGADFDRVLSAQPSNEDAAAGKSMAAKLPPKEKP